MTEYKCRLIKCKYIPFRKKQYNKYFDFGNVSATIVTIFTFFFHKLFFNFRCFSFFVKYDDRSQPKFTKIIFLMLKIVLCLSLNLFSRTKLFMTSQLFKK